MICGPRGGGPSLLIVDSEVAWRCNHVMAMPCTLVCRENELVKSKVYSFIYSHFIGVV